MSNEHPAAIDVRRIVTESLMSMIGAITCTTPPANEPPPPFIQAGIDRAVTRINQHLEPLIAEVELLKGIKPEGPPRPPEGHGLPRYGLRWNGPQQPLATPMDDGYWTPWHLADALKARCEELLRLLGLAWGTDDVSAKDCRAIDAALAQAAPAAKDGAQ